MAPKLDRHGGYGPVNICPRGFQPVARCATLMSVIDVAYRSPHGSKTPEEVLQMRSKLHMVYGVFEVDS